MTILRTIFNLLAKPKKDIETKFNTFLKDLIILSYQEEKQCELIGPGNTGTEMIINFGISHQYLDDFLNSKLINMDQKILLDNLAKYFDEMKSIPENLNSAEWKNIRQIVKNILDRLDAKNFEVVLDRSGKFFESKLIRS